MLNWSEGPDELREERAQPPEWSAQSKAVFASDLGQAVSMLRAEMAVEVRMLKQRLARCEQANRDLVARFDKAPWLIQEQK